MRTAAFCFAFLAIAPALQAQDAAALRARGLELGYNLDHKEALEAFRAAIAANPEDPTAYRLAAGAAWIQLLFNQGAITVDDYLGQARANVPRPPPDSKLAADFHDTLSRAIAISEARLRDRANDADAHYQAGSAYGFLASYTATIDGRLFGSLSPGRRAYREHERALELDPQRHDAGLIVGMYRYAVSNLRAPMRLMARLAGFGSDRERAVGLVEDAARTPSDVQANARFTLILIYNREARYDDALRTITELQQRYPRNRLLWLEQANTALRAGRPLEARRAIDEGLLRFHDDRRPKAFGEDARWRLARGTALVGLKDPDGATDLRAAVDNAGSDWVRGRARKELGKLADLAGDRDGALTQYRAASALCQRDRDRECVDEAHALTKAVYR